MIITAYSYELCKCHIYPTKKTRRDWDFNREKAHSKSRIETYAVSPICGETLCKIGLITSSETRTKLTVETQGF